MQKCFMALLATVAIPSLVLGQDVDLKSTKAKNALREYERTLTEVDKEFEKQLKDLEKSYHLKAELVRARLLSNLNEAMEEEARKVNLEEANKIDVEIKRYKARTLSNVVQAASAGGSISKARFWGSIEGDWVGRWGAKNKQTRTWRITEKKIVQLDDKGKAEESWEKAALNYKNGELFVITGKGSDEIVSQFLPIRFRGESLLMLAWRSGDPVTGLPRSARLLKKK